MPAYVVRLKASEKNPRELVGIYSARDPSHLAEFVDECCDASSCEYANLPAGGVYQGGRANPVPFTGDLETANADLLSGATFTESWFFLLINDQEDTLRWRPLERPEVAAPMGLEPMASR